MISWGGLTLCLSSAALYCLSCNSGRDATALKSVTRVNQLRDLAILLDSACKALPVVVTVAGRVGSDTPISCDHSSLRGVILEETAEQHFLKHNDTGSWIQDSALMLSISKEVPWYLDDGSGRIYVVGAREATGLELTVASEVFEESGRSLVRGTLDYLQGLKMLGVMRVERVLLTGTALTVVGEALTFCVRYALIPWTDTHVGGSREYPWKRHTGDTSRAVKDDQGILHIQRPHKGPFYVSPRSLDQLITNLGKWSRWYRYLSLGFTAFGIYVLTSHAVRHILEKRRCAALQRRVMEAAAQRLEHRIDTEDIREGCAARGEINLETLKDTSMPDLCVICLEQDYNAVFVPCGHLCCCISCSSQLTDCPLCRRHIDQVVKTYRH